MSDLEPTNKRAFKCEICMASTDLIACKRCMTETQLLMVRRLLEEKQDEVKTQKMLTQILQEIQELKEAISNFKVKGLIIKSSKRSYEDLF